VNVNVSKLGDMGRDIIVKGHRDVRDPTMVAVIQEYLASQVNDLVTQRRCEQEIDLACKRAIKADEDLQAMLKEMGGFSVIFQGLCFHPDDRVECWPAIPVINLIG
jgi:hypothetical protein